MNKLNKILTLLLTPAILFACSKQDNLKRSNAKNDSNQIENKTKQINTNLDNEFSLKSSRESLFDDNKKVKWVNFDEGLKLAKLNNKHIFIEFYTDWCTYCQKLDDETLANKQIVKYLNENFVSIRINAESKEKVNFQEKKLTKQELAAGFGVEGYPNLFFLTSEPKSLGNLPGFVNSNDFYNIASYIATDSYKTTSIEEYTEIPKNCC